MTENPISPTHLGRETPYGIRTVENDLLVFYRDAIVRYGKDGEALAEQTIASQAAALLPDGELVVGSGSGLSLFGRDLQTHRTLTSGLPEDVIDLIEVTADSFVSLDEAGQTLFWQREDERFSPVGQWPVECTPLFAISNGKSIVCAERGRLQERDPKTGTLLKSWPGKTTAVWGTAEPSGFQALTIGENGDCSVWDLSSREVLFGLALDFQAVRGCFSQDGMVGAVLGLDGEVARFKTVDGGMATVLTAPEVPLVALVYRDRQLTGIDENGGIWALGDEQPAALGGDWAGWATCSVFRAPNQVFVGTGTGSLETFQTDGQRLQPSLQLHQDAVVGLEVWGRDLLSVGADGSVKRVENPGTESASVLTLVEFPGQSVVGYALCPESNWLWIGLEDGQVEWLSPEGKSGSLKIEGRRLEEIRSAGSGRALVLTDQGSVRYLQAD